MELLEREGELSAIEGVVERGGVIVVEGGAGIGKTSLLNAAIALAQTIDRDVLRARGSELEQGFAFGVVRQLFERRVAAADPVEREALFAGPAAAALPLLSQEAVTAGADDISFAVLHGLYRLASNLGTRRHLVLCIDDGQPQRGVHPPRSRRLAGRGPRWPSHLGWVRSSWEALRPYSVVSNYVNAHNADEEEERTHEAYRDACRTAPADRITGASRSHPFPQVLASATILRQIRLFLLIYPFPAGTPLLAPALTMRCNFASITTG